MMWDRRVKPIDIFGYERALLSKAPTVSFTTLGDVRVSTVWLGIDHGSMYPKPLIFETMAFSGGAPLEVNGVQIQMRYTYEREAKIGHKLVCRLLALHFGLPVGD